MQAIEWLLCPALGKLKLASELTINGNNALHRIYLWQSLNNNCLIIDKVPKHELSVQVEAFFNLFTVNLIFFRKKRTNVKKVCGFAKKIGSSISL